MANGRPGLPRTVGSQCPLLTVRNHLQTAALHRRIRECNPYREHVGAVGGGVHHAVVLMPRIRARQDVGGAIREQALGRLDAYVLDRIGIDFGADKALGQIQNPLVGDDVEHRRPCPERRFGCDSGGHQAGVEVPGMVASGVAVDADQSLGERKIGVGGSELAARVQLACQAVEHFRILGKQRLDHRRGFQHALDQKVAVTLKPAELIGTRKMSIDPRSTVHRSPPAVTITRQSTHRTSWPRRACKCHGREAGRREVSRLGIAPQASGSSP